MQITHGQKRQAEVANAQHLNIVKLMNEVERCYRMLLSEPDTKGALFKAENILRAALADAKESQQKREPVRLTYEEFLAAEEYGVRLFKIRPGVRGQQMTEQDSVSWWVWRAIESAVLKANGIGGE
jgi:hypothetical protein